jgi:4-alpha-glucanotransferase
MSFPRASGILLHPTSLPSRGGIGDFGPSAYAFADFLASARQGLWQVLPLGPLGFGNSPYSSTSAFAGNPLLISLERLADRGWIDRARNR